MDELAREFPRVQKIAQRIASRYPEYHRDELESELLVEMVKAAHRWDRTKSSLPTFLEHRLQGAAKDWARKQNWSRRTGRVRGWGTPLVKGYEAIPAPDDTAETAINRITLRAIFTAFRDLPAREQVALAKTTDEAKKILGLSEQRTGTLRRQGQNRIRFVVEKGGVVGLTASDLTTREREVLGLVADGLSNHEIGVRLFVADDTIRNHVRNILLKVRARNRAHACVLAVRAGLI